MNSPTTNITVDGIRVTACYRHAITDCQLVRLAIAISWLRTQSLRLKSAFFRTLWSTNSLVTLTCQASVGAEFSHPLLPWNFTTGTPKQRGRNTWCPPRNLAYLSIFNWERLFISQSTLDDRVPNIHGWISCYSHSSSMAQIRWNRTSLHFSDHGRRISAYPKYSDRWSWEI